jgi:hypothetical protein
MLEKRTKSEKELRSLENKFFKAVKTKNPEQEGLFRAYQEKRKEIIMKKIAESNYNIAEDMRSIAEDFKEKYPGIASDAQKLFDDYSAKAEGEK